MRWSVFAGAGLLSLLAVSGSVFAAEIPIQARPKAAPPARPVAQPVQAPSNWSGSQVGGFNGASNMSNSFVEPGAFLCFPPVVGFPPNCAETPFQIKRHPWSYTIGGFVGYNWQLGNYVVGGEGDIAWKNAQSTSTLNTTVSSAGNFRTESFNGTIKQNWDSSIRARAGFLITPWTLIYGTGGVAFGDVKGSFGYAANISCGAVAPVFCSQTSGAANWSDTRVGWTVGGGVETALTPGFLPLLGPGWKARAEYRYTDFGTYSKSIPLAYSCAGVGCTTSSSNAIVNLHPTFHTIRVGLGYNF
jgi:outer membrane immunogenic protein